jgi:hypothetical protein
LIDGQTEFLDFHAVFMAPSRKLVDVGERFLGYKNVIEPDEERFTDPRRCEYFFTTEVPIIE